MESNMANFDKYAYNYVDYINKSSSITGEKYDFFVKLRITLMAEKIKKLNILKNDIKILDFGCGIGLTEAYLQIFFPNAQIYGVDESFESINIANSLRLSNVKFDIIEGESLPYADNFFDVIYSNGTFHHINVDKHIIIFKELNRIISKSGVLFVYENNPYNPLMVRAMKKNPFDRDAQLIYPSYLRSLFEAAGFKVKTTNYYFFYPRFLKFLRFSEKYLSWLPLGAQYFVCGVK